MTHEVAGFLVFPEKVGLWVTMGGNTTISRRLMIRSILEEVVRLRCRVDTNQGVNFLLENYRRRLLRATPSFFDLIALARWIEAVPYLRVRGIPSEVVRDIMTRFNLKKPILI